MDELVEVYVASDITFASLVKAQLEDADIPSVNVIAAAIRDALR